jgi:release factor glutamine methyltransferase
VTVLEVIQRSTDYLAKKGVESPRLQVELMLAHVLKLPRLQLYLNFERVLSEADLTTLRQIVQRRGTREPLQHILGSVSFCGIEIAVNRHVLIPRPETEQLAQLASQHLQARFASTFHPACGHPLPSSDEGRGQGEGCPLSSPTILDLCTGSGCLAIYLAVKHPSARVIATDISAEALEVALANASQGGVSERVTLLQGDLFDALTKAVPSPQPSPPMGAREPEAKAVGDIRFDLIVSNPPYIASAEIETLQPEVRDHDPRLALDGGADGLDFYRRLAMEAPRWLKPGGVLMAEFGDGQGKAVTGLFSQPSWHSPRLEKDLSERERFFIASVRGA